MDGYDINIVMPFKKFTKPVSRDCITTLGYKFAGEFWLTDYLRLEIGVDDSKVSDRNEFAGLSFSYPSRERPSLNFLPQKPSPVSVRADLNMKVRRNNRLVIETEGSGVVITSWIDAKFVNFFYLFSLTAGIIGVASAGDNTGAASQYVVTLTKNGIMHRCSSYFRGRCYLRWSGYPWPMEFDIASVAVGATVGAYSDANGLPIGTTYRYRLREKCN